MDPSDPTREVWCVVQNWNRIDFTIVVISLVDLLAQAADIAFLKSMRSVTTRDSNSTYQPTPAYLH